ncbi:MAG: hypothetical protein ACOYL6_02230 [Bacteriovoracaceae bacterium]
MAESIVDKIKAKLGTINIPFLKKKAPPAEEDADPDYNKANKKMEDIGLNTVGAQNDKTNPGLKAPNNEDSTEANNLEDIKASDKPKMILFRPIGKTKFSPVHVLVVLGVLYFGYDSMMGDEVVEEIVEVAPPKPKKDRKNKRKKNNEEGVVADAGATPTVDGAANIEAGTPTNVDSETKTPPTDMAEVTATPDPLAGGDTQINLDVAELNAEAEKKDKEEDAKPIAKPVPDVVVNAEAGGEATDEGTLSMTTGESSDSSTAPTKETDLAQDLLKNLNDGEEVKPETGEATVSLKPTVPPDYTRAGRGLVYNCKDGHWACIAREEYTTCKANHQWNDKNAKKMECYEVSIYATDKDCGNAQRIKVDTVAQTDFCK